jgi:putative membrane protein
MTSMTSFRRALTVSNVAVIAALGIAACKGKGEYADTTSAAGAGGATTGAAMAGTSTGAAAGGGGGSLSDPQIAHVAVTANSIDSAAGAAARSKARNAQVKDFAQTMVRDHGAVNKQAVALAKKLNVTPQDNDVSRQLQQGAQQSQTELGGKSGADYDKAYIDHEVQYHQAVLDALDKTLIPQAQNAELKGFLQKIRPVVAAHLDRAKRIQSTLGGNTKA